MRLPLTAFAHPEKTLLAMVSDRQNVVLPDEDIDLADIELALVLFQQVHDGEYRIAIFLDLRPLVAMARILDRQFVQGKLLLHLIQFLRCRIAQGNPDEAIRFGQIVADFLDSHVGQARAVFVGDTIDQHVLLPRVFDSLHPARFWRSRRDCTLRDLPSAVDPEDCPQSCFNEVNQARC